ncbi:MAG: hypothetical protein PVF99_06455, partial [Desulfobacterales bacterium]
YKVRFINRYLVKYDNIFFSQFCLPDGKAEDTPSALLERDCGSLLQLHPFRLASGASSTFAQLGCHFLWFKDERILTVNRRYNTSNTPQAH